MAKPPSMLTVEEAAQLLRIGRTKAYAMARQWRDSGGQRGLPVLDLGDVLRVSLARLEEFTGAEFSDGSGDARGAIKISILRGNDGHSGRRSAFHRISPGSPSQAASAAAQAPQRSARPVRDR